jgi:hypothetical protein
MITSMGKDDMFYKLNHDKLNHEKENITYIKPKRQIKNRVLYEDVEFGNINTEKLSNDSFTVMPSPPSNKKKVKYIVPLNTNKRFLITLKLLKELRFRSKDIGLTRVEFETSLINPLQKVANSRLLPKDKARRGAMSNSTDGEVENKPSSFKMPRKATGNLKKLYDKLKSEGKDVSHIRYENGTISFTDSAKLVRLYFSTHELKDPKHKRHFYIDDFTKSIFSEDKIESFYAYNGGRFITQGQLQALASLLVGNIVK